MIFLNASQAELLLHSPESGMGFQFVDVAMKGGPWVSGVAYNAEVLSAVVRETPADEGGPAADAPVETTQGQEEFSASPPWPTIAG